MTAPGKIDIKRAVSKGNSVYLEFYRKGELWYRTEVGELFSVPIEDTGDATFNKVEKAMMLMRYMRKWNTALDKGVTLSDDD